ncbi:hypothetical protein POTOM_037321 [Populus tomentosa]|uniref:GDSL esterase/lipase n=1 Tax=Populus tomentosa TaxID=118781 RepID=A0A8X7YVL7_POPTO|nr:hypothetical protein POTOM_037321 [Populus tomentosa]
MSSSRTQSFMFLLESMTTYITICVMYQISKTCIYHGASTSLLQRQEIKNLYNMNVRKVILMGLPPIGCAPYYLWRYNTKNGECIEEINDMILEFNFVMRYMIEEIGLELPDAKITFCDMYDGSMDIIKNHELYGFNVTADACYGLGKYKGWIMCFALEIACNNATNPVGSIPSN